MDLDTRRLTPRAKEVLAGLSSSAHTYAAELQKTVVETNSAVCDDLSSLRDRLVEQRTELIAVAGRLGMGVAAAGTVPLSRAEVQVTDDRRYRRMLDDYQLLVREQLICGMQVHVGIADPDLAVAVLERVARWLPPLLALSASSPFAPDGEDTGYASSRSLIWSRWPTTGSAGPLSSANEYRTLVQGLIASGVIGDPGMIYFDTRPSSHLPTVELRVCDACPSVDTVILIAGLFRAAAARELAGARAGIPATSIHPALVRAAMWRAARSGLEADLVDLRGPRALPARAVLEGMVDELGPELAASGDEARIRGLLAEALQRKSAAARQREALGGRGLFSDVVDRILAETADRRVD